MRYIDADALTFSRVRIIHSDGTPGGWNAVVMSSVINNAPTADVVEVVRCKDCKYLETDDEGFTYCCASTGLDGKLPDDFCSCAERRDG